MLRGLIPRVWTSRVDAGLAIPLAVCPVRPSRTGSSRLADESANQHTGPIPASTRLRAPPADESRRRLSTTTTALNACMCIPQLAPPSLREAPSSQPTASMRTQSSPTSDESSSHVFRAVSIHGTDAPTEPRIALPLPPPATCGWRGAALRDEPLTRPSIQPPVIRPRTHGCLRPISPGRDVSSGCGFFSPQLISN